jgi:hypothetical protein
MFKTLWIAFGVLAAMTAAHAQGDDPAAAVPSAEQSAPLSPERLDAPLNRKYLTSTGQTVPRPNLPQDSTETHRSVSPDPTLSNRKIIDLDKRIERSICSNC